MKYLLYLRDEEVKKFPLKKESITLGRSPECDLCIDEIFISHAHARITSFENHIKVEDLNSKNHVYVGQRMKKEAIIKLNKSFRIAHLEFFLKEGNPGEFAVSSKTWQVVHPKAILATKSREKTRTSVKLFDRSLATLLHLGLTLNHFEEILEWAERTLPTILKTGRLMILAEEGKDVQVVSSIGLDKNENPDILFLDYIPVLFDKKILNKVIEPGTSVYSFPLSLSNHRGALLYYRNETIPLAKSVVKFLEEFAVEASFIYRLIDNNKQQKNRDTHDVSPTIICKSRGMLGMLSRCKKMAGSDLSILITGENGTGKELVARFIHYHSGREREKYIALNCSAIPENLGEVELFGYEKGAFTDARERKIGKIESVSGGTLVLDEIADMSLPLQAKLLRVLQEQEFYRVGGGEKVNVDLRIVSLTNQDLPALIAKKLFREDLYHRISGDTIRIPPLWERKEDIRNLVNHFFKKFAWESRVYPKGFSFMAMEALESYPWPGNVRELESTVKSLVNRSGGGEVISFDLLKEEVKSYFLRYKNEISEGHPQEDLEREKEKIERLLMENRWNRSRVAKLLGISRTAFYKKLKKLNIQQ